MKTSKYFYTYDRYLSNEYLKSLDKIWVKLYIKKKSWTLLNHCHEWKPKCRVFSCSVCHTYAHFYFAKKEVFNSSSQ